MRESLVFESRGLQTNTYYKPDVIQYSDYYPFGMQMPSRTYTPSDSYKYGFQGQEKDDEVSGEGNSYTAEFWQYSPRIGRRWNQDPVVKPWQSNYSCFSDNPISRVDPNGDDDYFDSQGNYLKTVGKTNFVKIETSSGVFKKLSETVFNTSNAKPLANIGNYYAKKIAENPSSLTGGSISVGKYTLNSKNQWYSKSLYNNGSAGNEDIMNQNSAKNAISFSLDSDGKLFHFLDDINNLKSSIRHEFKHKKYSSNDGFEHLQVYYEQMQSPEYENTTSDFKENAKNNVRELLNQAEGYTNEGGKTNFTPSQIEAIHKKGMEYEKKFSELYKKQNAKKQP